MAELVSKLQFQQALQEAVKPGMKPKERAPYAETIRKYVGQLETAAEETAGEIERLGAQVLDLGQRPTKDELERVSGELKLAQETVRAHEDALQKLRAELEKASGEENSLVVELKEQIAQLESSHEQATLEQKQVIERLEADVQRLTHAAEDHPRQIDEITRRAEGEAQKTAALQLEMRRYQEAALEVARTSHGEVQLYLKRRDVSMQL